MNQQDLDKCRQFQVEEQTPLIILIDDDYANHVKGLSFRSVYINTIVPIQLDMFWALFIGDSSN